LQIQSLEALLPSADSVPGGQRAALPFEQNQFAGQSVHVSVSVVATGDAVQETT
jgi:hypothetical protein